MKINNRRDFIKKVTLAGASAVAFPQLLSCANDNSQKTIPMSEIKKDTFPILGMSCASCAARVDKAFKVVTVPSAAILRMA